MMNALASAFPACFAHVSVMGVCGLLLVLGASLRSVSAVWLATFGAFAAAAAAVVGLQSLGALSGSTLLWSGTVVVDAASVACSVVCALCAAVVLFSSAGSPVISRSAERYWPGMVVLTSTFLMLAAHAHHLAALLVATEVSALGLVALVGVGRAQARGSEAATKAVVVGAVAFGLSAFGMALVFGGSGGALDYAALNGAFATRGPSAVATFGAFLIVAGFLFRLGGAPFHMAAPDVIDGAPLPASMLSVSAVRICWVVAMLRFIRLGFFHPSVSADVSGLALYLGWAAALSMLVGSVGAVRQEQLKRMLAYLSISQLGFVLVAIVALSQNAPLSANALGACLLGQVVALLLALTAANHIASNHEGPAFVDDLAGLAKTRPLVAFALSASMLSVSAMPFTMGFVGVFPVLLATWSVPLMLPLGIVALVAFLVGLYPAWRVIGTMYFREPTRTWPDRNPAGSAAVLVTGTLALLLFGMVTGPWLAWSHRLVP